MCLPYIFFLINYRNRAKRNSFTILNLVSLLLKTTLDCVARIVLFGTWLYIHNEGKFSSVKTTIAYYSTLMVLVLFNALFTKSKKNVTRRNMTGNYYMTRLKAPYRVLLPMVDTARK